MRDVPDLADPAHRLHVEQATLVPVGGKTCRGYGCPSEPGGEISTRLMKTITNAGPVKHLAYARFGDHDGKVRAALTGAGVTP